MGTSGFFTVFLFLVFMISELSIFFYFTKSMYRDNNKYVILTTTSSIIFKVVFIYLGVLNYPILWLTTCFLYIYLWGLGLKLRYKREYDLFFLINVIGLITSLFISILLVSQKYFYLVLIIFGITLYVLSSTIPYLVNRRRALILRTKAYEAFKQRNYEEAKNYLLKGIDHARKIVSLRGRYVRSKLQKLMEGEVETLQHFLDEKYSPSKNELETSKELFNLPKISKDDIKNHIIMFVISTCILAIAVFPLYFLLQ
ncbi:MAG: hypothetical protein ACFFBC_12660 [Promethearchaeota archaeon]